MGSSSLAGHVEGLRHREAKEACAQLLNRAREALVSANAGDATLESRSLDLQNTAAGGPSDGAQTALFAFPVCETSTAAQSTVALMKECVQLAASRYGDDKGASRLTEARTSTPSTPRDLLNLHLSLLAGAADVALQTIDQLLDLFRVTRAGDNAVGPVSTVHILLTSCT